VSLSQGLDHNMLMVAAGLGDLPIVQCLVEIGGRELLMAKTKHESLGVLAFAAYNGHMHVAKYLAEQGGQELLMATDEEGWTALTWAVHRQIMPAVVCLAGMGGMDLLNIKDVDGNTAMSLASRDWGKEKLTAFCNLKSIKGLKDKKVAEYLSKVGKMRPASKFVYTRGERWVISDEEEEEDESGSEEE